MLNTRRYSYYGNEIRFKEDQSNLKVEWDKGLFTNYLTNTHHSNDQDLETVIFDLPTEVQFKILGDLLQSNPVLAFKIIFKYYFQTFYGLTSAVVSCVALVILCQFITTMLGNLFH
jgi:hypothetical protein